MSLTDDNNLDAYKAIGEEGGTDALALVATCMEQNARHLDHIETGLRASIEADRDRWKRRAIDAEAQLAAIERRMMGLLFAPPQPQDFDE